jgi:hypothetical protein
MTPNIKTTCEARIYERPHMMRWHRCTNAAKGERQGHKACGTHLRGPYAPYWVRPDEGYAG